MRDEVLKSSDIAPDHATVQGAMPPRPVSNFYRNYVLILITMSAVLSYLDRQIMGILLPQIKREFDLQDWQLGFMTGPAFSFIFIALTIPLAIVADRTSRAMVISVCTLLFSVMTIACGYAGSFIQLCLGRFGIGIGEAGTLPASNSIIAELFPLERRATATAVLGSGVNIGLLVAYLAGGYVAENYGWRNAFLLAGGPGLVVALLFFFTVKMPRQSSGPSAAQNATFKETFLHMWAIPAYRWLVAGSALATWSLAGMFSFTPLFLVQNHGISISDAGYLLALYCGVLGAIATYTTGVVADRVGKRHISKVMLVPTFTYGVIVPFVFIFYLSPNSNIALIAGAVPLMLVMSYGAPAFALAQTLALPHMRAQSVAILITACYLFGSGMGPFFLGLASDLLRPIAGDQSLPYALLLTALSNGMASLCFWRGYKLMRPDPVERNSYHGA